MFELGDLGSGPSSSPDLLRDLPVTKHRNTSKMGTFSSTSLTQSEEDEMS